MARTARDRILDFLADDRIVEGNSPQYYGCTNGVIERETKLNGNTIRKVLGQLAAEQKVVVTHTGTTVCYKLA